MAVLTEVAPALWPYEPRVFAVEEAFVDPAYQRPLTTLAKEIAEDFRPYLVGALTLSERQRKEPNLAIIDGQNRWVGAQGAGVSHLLAVVYTDLTRADEAVIFSDLQQRRRNLSSYQRFRAALVGKDEQSLGIMRIAQAAGYELSTTQQADTLKAVGALEWAYRGCKTKSQTPLEEGPEYLSRALVALKTAWPDYSQPNGDIIKGSALIYAKAEGQLDDDRFTRSLRDSSPSAILERAQQIRRGKGGGGMGASYVAEVLTSNYAKTRKAA